MVSGQYLDILMQLLVAIQSNNKKNLSLVVADKILNWRKQLKEKLFFFF